MLKKVLIIVGSIVLLLAIVFGIAFISAKPSKETMVKFMTKNPDRFAISLSENKKPLIEHQSDSLLPLASTLKIIIAIEYAFQAKEGKIKPNEELPVSVLSQYHYPSTDGGAHSSWVESLKLNTDSVVTMEEVAKGMIKYSSNANTEYLSDRLGLGSINHRIKELGINKHDSIYYLVSSLFVKSYKFPNQEKTSAIKSLKNLSPETYQKACKEIHLKLKNGTFKYDSLNEFGLEAQKVWSDRLPGSTAKEYRKLMEKLNSKTKLPEEVHVHLDPVLEFIMDNPNNQSWLKHSGFKGGSTASLLSKALYATKENGEQIALSYFLTDLSNLEQIQLSMSMNAFEIAILQDEKFRKEFKRKIDLIE